MVSDASCFWSSSIEGIITACFLLFVSNGS